MPDCSDVHSELGAIDSAAHCDAIRQRVRVLGTETEGADLETDGMTIGERARCRQHEQC